MSLGLEVPWQLTEELRVLWAEGAEGHLADTVNSESLDRLTATSPTHTSTMRTEAVCAPGTPSRPWLGHIPNTFLKTQMKHHLQDEKGTEKAGKCLSNYNPALLPCFSFSNLRPSGTLLQEALEFDRKVQTENQATVLSITNAVILDKAFLSLFCMKWGAKSRWPSTNSSAPTN